MSHMWRHAPLGTRSDDTIVSGHGVHHATDVRRRSIQDLDLGLADAQGGNPEPAAVLCWHRWDRGYAKYGPVEWLGFFVPCVSWLRKYDWAENLLVHPATLPTPILQAQRGGGGRKESSGATTQSYNLVQFLRIRLPRHSHTYNWEHDMAWIELMGQRPILLVPGHLPIPYAGMCRTAL